MEESDLKKAELEKLHETISKERDIAHEKLNKVKKLHEEVEEEYNARTGMVYAIERLIALKE